MIAATFSSEAVAQLWAEFHRDRSDASARNRLLETYLPLVHHHAQRMHARMPAHVEVEDLVQTGTFGLMDALESYNPGRNVRFEGYCTLRIRGAMLDAIRDLDRVPRSVRAKAKLLAAASRSLVDRLGREPTDAELAAAMEISEEDLGQIRLEVRPRGLGSLDTGGLETDGDEELRLREVLPDRRAVDPGQRLRDRDTLSLITRGLNRSERLLVIMYYYEDRTFREVGRTLGVSESRISQMHSEMLVRLRARLEDRREELGVGATKDTK